MLVLLKLPIESYPYWNLNTHVANDNIAITFIESYPYWNLNVDETEEYGNDQLN